MKFANCIIKEKAALKFIIPSFFPKLPQNLFTMVGFLKKKLFLARTWVLWNAILLIFQTFFFIRISLFQQFLPNLKCGNHPGVGWASCCHHSVISKDIDIYFASVLKLSQRLHLISPYQSIQVFVPQLFWSFFTEVFGISFSPFFKIL